MIKIRGGGAAPGVLILALIQALWLGGCGFHLRGSAPLPPSLSSVYLEQQESPLIAEALNRAFTEQRLAPVDDKSRAQMIIGLLDERYQRRVLSVGASGNVQEYELIYSVDVAVLDARGEPLADTQTLTVRRELRYESSEVVAKAGEEQQLKSEMIADAAAQIIRRLQFIDLRGV